MIHGKPVISHKSKIANGHKTFVKHCGYFTRIDNEKQYARYIRKFYNDKEKRIQLGERGRQFAIKNFLLENIGKKLESYYFELMS